MSLVETSFRVAFDNRNGATAGLMLIPFGHFIRANQDHSYPRQRWKHSKQFARTLPPLQKAFSVLGVTDFPETVGAVGTVEVSTTGGTAAR